MIKIHEIDAFTKIPGQGNRAGVVLDADNLCDKDMQEIAKFANFSETAFVIKSSDNNYDVEVRYFTPAKEVPICGHATIATHFLRALQQDVENNTANYQKRVLAKTGVGILPVDIEKNKDDIHIIMTQSAPEFGEVLSLSQIHKLANALRISTDDFKEELPIQTASTGHSKVMIPLKSREILDNISQDEDLLLELSHEIDCNGFFPFVIEHSNQDIQTYGRMFAPAIGISEDPVTGNANGPAGAYLYKHGIITLNNASAPYSSFAYTAHQGISMGKPGSMEVRLTKLAQDQIQVQIAGSAVQAGHLEYFHS